MKFLTELDKMALDALKDFLKALKSFHKTLPSVFLFLILVFILWKCCNLGYNLLRQNHIRLPRNAALELRILCIFSLIVNAVSHLSAFRAYTIYRSKGDFSYFGWFSIKDAGVLFASIVVLIQVDTLYTKLIYSLNMTSSNATIVLFTLLFMLFGVALPFIIYKISRTIRKRYVVNKIYRMLYFVFVLFSNLILCLFLILAGRLAANQFSPVVLTLMTVIVIYVQSYFAGALLYRMYEGQPHVPDHAELLDTPIE